MRGGVLRASSVLARRDNDVAVFDTGMVHHSASFVTALAAEGLTPEDVTLVFNTHAHVDHSHNNALFPRAQIWCSRRDREWTRAFHEVLASVDHPGPEHAEPFYPDIGSRPYNPKLIRKVFAIDKLLWDERGWGRYDRTVWLEEATPPPGIRVVPTAGHAPHHVSFAIQTGARPVLVCGDALLHLGDLEAALPVMPPWDLTLYHASHAMIRAFDGIIVPGHDTPFDNVPFRK
jgi:glyoxylase-like metal-dependent hydrolase (beta-lactamase superfamily II)